MDEFISSFSNDGLNHVVDQDGARARAVAESASDEVARLRQRVGALELMVEALVRTAVSSGQTTPDQLAELLKSIDAEDGVMDGRRDLSRMRKLCPTCSRANAGDKLVCMWCNADFSRTAVQPA